MPYINGDSRLKLDVGIDNLISILEIRDIGSINYVISRIISGVMKKDKISYTHINSLIGVLSCSQLELYRRIAIPYEDGKIKDNGDIKEYK